MTERMLLIGEAERVMTPDEPWLYKGWYVSAADFACEHLSPSVGRMSAPWTTPHVPGRCLVIGSPLPELRRLQAIGWKTTYVDVRLPPEDVGEYIQADATDLPLQDATFDAVSSTCVLCHAGLGRYGDPIKPNGDRLMLAEIARVLKPGGLAAVMAGPAIPGEFLQSSVVYGNVHRVYRPEDFEAMAGECGLDMIDSTMYTAPEWLGIPEIEDLAGVEKFDVNIEYCYLSALLRRPT